MPQWIVDRFVAAYGEKKAEEIFKTFHNKSTISIRTNLTLSLIHIYGRYIRTP